jgi:hypothetical protein
MVWVGKNCSVGIDAMFWDVYTLCTMYNVDLTVLFCVYDDCDHLDVQELMSVGLFNFRVNCGLGSCDSGLAMSAGSRVCCLSNSNSTAASSHELLSHKPAVHILLRCSGSCEDQY